ncbi:MAG: biotin/lipoyl-containing protein [Desulfobacterales bacterium]|nr:biotin/lipoyl-containing protein [Desulfobacterales bacterium]
MSRSYGEHLLGGLMPGSAGPDGARRPDCTRIAKAAEEESAMSRSFKLPDLGEGIHEGEVLAVLVAVGDTVREGDPILEVETDKAAVEIPSPVNSTSTKSGEARRRGQSRRRPDDL